MIPKTRILLLLNGELRSFFFVQPYSDGSIYFGSTHPKPSECIIGEADLKPGEKSKNVLFSEGKSVDPEISKYSYHPSPNRKSGRVHLKNKEGKYLFSFDTIKLSEIINYYLLCTIIPSNPQSYPIFTKKKELNDIVIPIDPFNGHPFCVEIFLVRKDYDYNQILQKDSSLFIVGHCEGQAFNLIINLFIKETLITWPLYNIIIVSKNGKSIIVEKNVI